MLAIILSIQMYQPSVICTLLVLVPLLRITHSDYKKFKSLGPGGTPPTFCGYLKITVLRLFALSDPYTPTRSSKPVQAARCYHQCMQLRLRGRTGPRPQVAGIAPQRQLDQPGCFEMYQSLRKSLECFALDHKDLFGISTSCFEKNGLALFARNPVKVTCRGEICHVHHSDQSLHMSLHPDDANVVLENGWGERHPLARGGWMTAYVPREFVMVYAPRDRVELDTVCRIIEASVLWVCGKRLERSLGMYDIKPVL
jgi:hypothetical protein